MGKSRPRPSSSRNPAADTRVPTPEGAQGADRRPNLPALPRRSRVALLEKKLIAWIVCGICRGGADRMTAGACGVRANTSDLVNWRNGATEGGRLILLIVLIRRNGGAASRPARHVKTCALTRKIAHRISFGPRDFLTEPQNHPPVFSLMLADCHVRRGASVGSGRPMARHHGAAPGTVSGGGTRAARATRHADRAGRQFF
jgi:hypothetical protein